MSKQFIKHTSCPKCGSSDALSVYSDGYYKCFSSGCDHFGYTKGQYENFKSLPKASKMIEHSEHRDIQSRKLTQETCQLFDYSVGLDANNNLVHIANYYDRALNRVAQKTRDGEKNFRFLGNGSNVLMFGQQAFKAGGKVLTITEGEIDAMSVYQVNGGWPVVSIPKGVKESVRTVEQNIDYINSFEKVVFMFDMEPEAQDYAKKCAALVSPGKAAIAHLPLKDANECLLAGRDEDVKKAIWNAKEFRPDGIISPKEFSLDVIKALCERGIDIKFPKLNEKIRGLHSGAIYTLAAREKAGKTSFTKEMVMGLLDSGSKVGVIYLEEDGPEVALSFVSMMNNVPLWKAKEDLSLLGGEEGIKQSLQELTDQGLSVYDHKGEFTPSKLLEVVRYMSQGLGCEVIILDNLSISLAAGGDSLSDTNKIVAQMVSVCKNTGVSLINVVHLKKNRLTTEGNDSEVVNAADVYGTGAFAKFSHVLMALERDPECNSVKIKVIRNRTTGFEGYADTLYYIPETGRLNTKSKKLDNPTDIGYNSF